MAIGTSTIQEWVSGYGSYGADVESLGILLESTLQLTLEHSFEKRIKNTTWEHFFQRTKVKSLSFPIKAVESLPTMKRFISQRHHQVMRALQGDCRSYKYDITMDIDMDMLRFPGMFQLALEQTRSMAYKQAKFVERRAFNFLASCDSITGMDGDYVCAATHHGSATNQNKLALNFSRTSYETAKKAMRLFQDATGDVWGSEPNILVIHPNSLEDAQRLLRSPLLIGYGTTDTEAGNINVFHNDVNVVIAHTQLVDGQFFLIDTNDGAKPFIFNEPQGGVLWDDEGNTAVKFERDTYSHGGIYHFGMAPTDRWYKILGSYNGTWATLVDPASETD